MDEWLVFRSHAYGFNAPHGLSTHVYGLISLHLSRFILCLWAKTFTFSVFYIVQSAYATYL